MTARRFQFNLSRACLFVSCLAWLLAPSIGAAEKEAAPARRIAIIVGSNEGIAGRSPLRHAHDDAQSISEVLQQVGQFAPGDVTLMLDPEPAAVLKELDRGLEILAREGGESMLLFYYSGHADEQTLFPDGKPLALKELKARLENQAASVRVGIIDACAGGGWTRTKGMTGEPPFNVALPLTLAGEGSVLIASSSGLESAHESESLQGSFFTHHFVAALRGAADQRGTGEVTLGEAFAYAKELTIRDTALEAGAPQHPSFDMNLRGRSDLPLARVAQSGSVVDWQQTSGPLQLVHLGTGLVLLEVPAGKRNIKLTVPVGKYLLRHRQGDKTYGREIDVLAGETIHVSEESLDLVGASQLAAKGPFKPADALLTTLPRNKWLLTLDSTSEIVARDGLGSSRGNVDLALAYGVTDRLQLKLDNFVAPQIAYRFGDRGVDGSELVPYLGLGGASLMNGDVLPKLINRPNIFAGVDWHYWMKPTGSFDFGLEIASLPGATSQLFSGLQNLAASPSLGMTFFVRDNIQFSMKVAYTSTWLSGGTLLSPGDGRSQGQLKARMDLRWADIIAGTRLYAHLGLTSDRATTVDSNQLGIVFGVGYTF